MRLNGTVFSQTLQMDTGLTIVTPNVPQPEYKVVYLLHGLCGNHQSWLDYSMLPVYAMAGSAIYIMPEAGRSFYHDMVHGFRYFTYLTEELPEICRNLFHISAKREDTAIMGCSMGGYGALKCAFYRPEQYGMCAAFSSGCLQLREGLRELRENGMRQEFIDAFGMQLVQDFQSIFGGDYEWKPEYDLLALARENRGALRSFTSPAARRTISIRITCGSVSSCGKRRFHLSLRNGAPSTISCILMTRCKRRL